jgi:hypothetical protein
LGHGRERTEKGDEDEEERASASKDDHEEAVWRVEEASGRIARRAHG